MQIINRNELAQMLARRRDVVLIEALAEDDYARRHLPCAINVPLDDAHFAERVREAVPEPEYNIVVYCSNADSAISQRAASRIEALGYVSVYQYRDGKEGWFREGANALQ